MKRGDFLKTLGVATVATTTFAQELNSGAIEVSIKSVEGITPSLSATEILRMYKEPGKIIYRRV